MKTKIIALFALLLAVTAPAQITNINYTTVYSPTTYTNFLRMTIPGVATNVTVTIVTTNSQVGDSLTLTAIKINSNFHTVTNSLGTNVLTQASVAFVNNQFAAYYVTNGAVLTNATSLGTPGLIPYSTNDTIGYYWAAPPAGGSGGTFTSSNLAALFGLSYAVYTNGTYYILTFQAQTDTNHVTLTGGVDCTGSAGNMNQTYTLTNGVYVGNNNDGWTLATDGYGNWYIGDDYFSTNFPYTWAPIACTNPPTGSYNQIYVPVYTPATNISGLNGGGTTTNAPDVDPFILTQAGLGTNTTLFGTNFISGTTFYQPVTVAVSSNVVVSTNVSIVNNKVANTNQLVVILAGASFANGTYFYATNYYKNPWCLITNSTGRNWELFASADYPTAYYYYATNGVITTSSNAWKVGSEIHVPTVAYGLTNYLTTNTVYTTNVTFYTNSTYLTNSAAVAIGTNNAGTNALFVCGTVNSTVGFYVNGVQILPGTNSTFITNTVTAYNFTNQVLQSKQIVSYTTNYAYWSASNYLARVAGLVSWQIASGDDGGANPSTAPSTFPMTLYGTYATNFTGWFLITNGFVTQSNISLYVTLGTNSWGTTLANPGQAALYSVDHWELYGRTNFMDYQLIGSKVGPQYGWQYVNADYVNNLFQSAFNNNFSTSKDTNNVTHFAYSSQNHVMFDLTSSTKSVPGIGLTPGGYAVYTDTYGNTFDYPTNVVMTIPTTNLATGYTLLAQTNLLNVFFAITNYTASTSGTNTLLTIPVIPGPGQWFFYVVNGFNFGATFNEAVTFNGGTLYPSNTWSLATITNGLASGNIITVNSNGVNLVDVWMSNGVPILKPHW
jgi:hypothetical protein